MIAAARGVFATGLLWVLFAAVAAAQPPESTDRGFEFGLRSGFREDDIQISVDNTFGGALTVDLRNTNIHHLELYGRARVKQGFYYRGSLALGWYFDGDLLAKETGDDGALNPDGSLGRLPLTLTGTVDGERLFDATGGVGYQLSFFGDRLRIAPLGGYSFHKNNVATSSSTFTVIDGADASSVGPATGFDTQWSGPWIGADVTAFINSKFSAIAGFEHHWLDVTATPRITSPGRPRKERGTGTGFAWSGGLRYRFARIFTGEVLYRGHDWSATTGRNFSVGWQSYRFTAGGIFHF
ncbi:MAG: hypothetical protein HRU01_09045 [Myxococcales bacterium]|nr:hypothetical protein [Myxococcales bacterium]